MLLENAAGIYLFRFKKRQAETSFCYKEDNFKLAINVDGIQLSSSSSTRL